MTLLLLLACALPTPVPIEDLLVEDARAACEAGSGQACLDVAAAYVELAATRRATDPEACCLAPARDWEARACAAGHEEGCRALMRHALPACDAALEAPLARLCLDHGDLAACAEPARRAAAPDCAWSEGLPEALVPAALAACEGGDAASCRAAAAAEADPARAFALHARACGVLSPLAASCADAAALLARDLRVEDPGTTRLDLMQRACKLDPDAFCGPWAELALGLCEQGQGEACVRLAKAVEQGSPELARELMQKGCAAGVAEGCAGP